MLELTNVLSIERPTTTWAAALLRALAREERVGRRPARITEPDLATWKRFRGRLTAADFVSLIFEDAAVLHPIPFDGKALKERLDASALLNAQRAEGWLKALAENDQSTEYLAEQARVLALPWRFGRSELHVVKPHQRVLELPGAGGQLSHHLVTTHPGLTLQDNFTIACHSWQELTMAGVVALDVGAPHTRFVQHIDLEALKDPDHPLRTQSFDFVVGLNPDRGGFFRIADQLAIWFPTARVLLV